MVSIDKAGRIVIPKAIRDQLDLHPDVPLTIDVEGSSIRINRTGDADRPLLFTDNGRPYFPATGDERITDLDVQRIRDGQVR